MADEATPVFQIQRMYLKDLSLEQPNSPQILLEQQQPQVDINLAVGAEQGHQLATAVQCHQVIVAAHVGVADVDLRHRAAAGDLHHVAARGGVGVDADLLDLLHALGLEDLLGPDAVGADGGGVHLHGLHGEPSSFFLWD